MNANRTTTRCHARATVAGSRVASNRPGSSRIRRGLGSGRRLVQLFVPVVLAEVITLVRFHEGRPTRQLRARTSRRRDRARRRARDRRRSSPSRRCSSARTARCRICGCRSRDGQQIQLLTTRDTDDPDALYVLRHSAAHLLAEAVRRLYPGVKIAIGPPIENGFYYDFEFPEPITEADLAKIEDEVRRELEGRPRVDAARRSRATRRRRASRPRASRTRSSSSTPPRATSPSTPRGTSPTSAAARTCRTRSRSRRSS